jgi:hypothetical protein
LITHKNTHTPITKRMMARPAITQPTITPTETWLREREEEDEEELLLADEDALELTAVDEVLWLHPVTAFCGAYGSLREVVMSAAVMSLYTVAHVEAGSVPQP